MKKNIPNVRLLSVLVTAAVGLVACGGGDSSSIPPPPVIPCTEAFPIVGGVVNSTFIGQDNSTCYSFHGVEGTTYTIRLDMDLNGDADLVLYRDLSFNADSKIDYSINSGNTPEVVAFAPATGTGTQTYILEVYGYLDTTYNVTIYEN